MAGALTEEMLSRAQVLTFVPTGFRRVRGRGYDQSRLIARELSKLTGIPCRRLLVKRRDNPPQSLISDDSRRRANVLGAYRALKGRAEDMRVLLVDDVFTTGATLTECARVLLTAGAKSVDAVVAAAADRKRK
jgi:ComF family protein